MPYITYADRRPGITAEALAKLKPGDLAKSVELNELGQQGEPA